MDVKKTLFWVFAFLLLASGALYASQEDVRLLEEKQISFKSIIDYYGIFIALAVAFVVGLGVGFTPCVWPMYPITASIILGTKDEGARWQRNLSLSLVYVLGLSITYSVIGLLSGLLGGQVQSFIHGFWPTLVMSIIFILLALSMFGLFELSLPSWLLTRLRVKRRGGNFIGVFLMGLVAGLVASPCMAVPLAAILLYIVKWGDAWRGFWLLFFFAWGMGAFLVVIGTFAGSLRFLPKAGSWMVRVKQVFGVILIGAAVYFLYPFLVKDSSEKVLAEAPPKSSKVQDPVTGDFRNASPFEIEKEKKEAKKPGGEDMGEPSQKKEGGEIAWQYDYESALQEARREKKPLILKFTADWCVYCRKMDKEVFLKKPIIVFCGTSMLWDFPGVRKGSSIRI